MELQIHMHVYKCAYSDFLNYLWTLKKLPLALTLRNYIPSTGPACYATTRWKVCAPTPADHLGVPETFAKWKADHWTRPSSTTQYLRSIPALIWASKNSPLVRTESIWFIGEVKENFVGRQRKAECIINGDPILGTWA